MIQQKGSWLLVLVLVLEVKDLLALSYTEQICPDLPGPSADHSFQKYPGSMSANARFVAVGITDIQVFDTTTCLQVGSDIEFDDDSFLFQLAFSGDGTTLVASVGSTGGNSFISVYHLDGSNNWVEDPAFSVTNVQSWALDVSHDGNSIAYIEDTATSTIVFRVIRWDGSTWSHVGTGISSDDSQGNEVMVISSSGNVIAVLENAPGDVTGARGRVFELTEGDWSQLGSELTCSGPFLAKMDLSADGHTAVLSCPFFEGDQGVIRVYSYGTDWSQVGSDIRAPDTGVHQNSGANLALSADGNIVAFAAWDVAHTDDNSISDSFHVYFNDGGSWVSATMPEEALGPDAGWWIGLSDDGQTVASSAGDTIFIFTQPASSSPTLAPTQAPTTSPTTSSPTALPTDSPTTSSPTQEPTTSSPTDAPTLSPTMSPTFSPTVSPSASPTTPCSTLVQRLTITEKDHICPPPVKGTSPHTCDRGDKSTDKANHHYNRHFEDVVVDALQVPFGEVPFTIADLILSFETDGAWASADATTRVHHIVLEYRPNSPVSHIDVGAAGASLEANPFGVAYCGCQSTLHVTASSYEYRMAEERGTSAVATPGGKCRGEYKAKQGKGTKKNKKAKASSASALGAGGALEQVSAGVVTCGLVVVVAILVATVAVRRARRLQTYTVLDKDTPVVVMETSKLLD